MVIPVHPAHQIRMEVVAAPVEVVAEAAEVTAEGVVAAVAAVLVAADAVVVVEAVVVEEGDRMKQRSILIDSYFSLNYHKRTKLFQGRNSLVYYIRDSGISCDILTWLKNISSCLAMQDF